MLILFILFISSGNGEPDWGVRKRPVYWLWGKRGFVSQSGILIKSKQARCCTCTKSIITTCCYRWKTQSSYFSKSINISTWCISPQHFTEHSSILNIQYKPFHGTPLSVVTGTLSMLWTFLHITICSVIFTPLSLQKWRRRCRKDVQSVRMRHSQTGDPQHI